MPRKRLFVIYAGGTIGMHKTANGYVPHAGLLPEALQQIAARQPGFPAYSLKTYQPLLDSSNLEVGHWNRMAEDIARHYAEYDGFVLVHGTDTLAYTASALSFMLENLSKPVIVTGAMVPLCETPNDAEQNLVDAFYWAAHSDLREVAIAFNRELFRGNRARKLWGNEMGAFGSPNYPMLGRVQGQHELNPALFYAKPAAPFVMRPIRADLRIIGLKLYPGYTASLIRQVLDMPLDAVVLESYGAGNAPDTDPALLDAFAAATRRGVAIVNVSQCLSGRVSMETYATGVALARAGLISGRDMTPEAALAKLYFLLSSPDALLGVEDRVPVSLRGELSPG